MALNVGKMLSELREMTVTELRGKYAEVHGEPTRSFHRDFLIRKIAWRMQANAEGGLPERAKRRALEIANDADLRVRAPESFKIEELGAKEQRGHVRRLKVIMDRRLPMPGALLTREYRGRVVRVRVLPDGFDYEGTVHRSLSAVAKQVTGKHWNGFHFFGLTSSRKGKAS
jgi:hypothetical protein